MKELSERLKIIRTDLHLSQDYVAKVLGIQRSAIVQIENNNRKVSADELSKLSSLFGIPIDELIHGDEAEIPNSMFARSFSELDEIDQREIINLIKFKKMMKDQRVKNAR